MCAKQNRASGIGLAAQPAARHAEGTPSASLRAATAVADSFVPGWLQGWRGEEGERPWTRNFKLCLQIGASKEKEKAVLLILTRSE